ncbi:hypothetical protein [Roseomonas sp. BN140053]|uniref:hypothetical protein n=1 Tax=Roseomonas sp. BN140053 TaxID=3391898 RepID=UPI0039E990B2
MSGFSWFAFARNPDPAAHLGDAAAGAVLEILRGVPALRRGLVFTPPPGQVAHPFPGDERAPMLALQLDFATIEALEAAVAAEGPLRALADAAHALPPGTAVTQQAMVRRSFPVPDATIRTASGGLPCSYLVHYPGPAEDMNAWLGHYIRHHPALMAHFPDVREIEIYSRLDWCGGLPWAREEMMQRNKLVFDSPEALSAGLLSPALKAMRADFHQFPPFAGGNVHYTLLTRQVGGTPD